MSTLDQDLLDKAAQLANPDTAGSGSLRQAISLYETLLADSSFVANPGLWLTAVVRMADALVSLGELDTEQGSFTAAVQRFTTAAMNYEHALGVLNQETEHPSWVWVKGGLGRCLLHLGELRSDSDTLERAALVLREALDNTAKQEAPHTWSSLSWRLANVLQAMAERELGIRRVEEAIDAYNAALLLRPQADDPMSWATLQNDLGTAYAILGERQTHSGSLQLSARAYQSALKVFTRDNLPYKWAMVKFNLGATLWALGERDGHPRNLEKAIRAYKEALEVRTQEQRPHEWAMTQHGLGVTLLHLGRSQRNRDKLEEACVAFRNALTVMTLDGNPVSWAQTSHSLANSLATLGEQFGDMDAVKSAIVIHRDVLAQTSSGAIPRQRVLSQASLAHGLRLSGHEDRSTAELEEAVQLCRSVLLNRKVADDPLGWASSMVNLSQALTHLSLRTGDHLQLQEAWLTLEQGWKVFQEKGGVPDFDPSPARPLLSDEELQEYGRIADQHERENFRGWLFDITLSVLKHFLGGNWVKKHLYAAGPLKPPLVGVDPVEHFHIGLIGHRLAEMLFNLQHEDGFEDVRQRLMDGNIEAVMSELQAARFLKMQGEKFRFVTPIGRKGSDYDLELLRADGIICCEVKAKLDQSAVTEESIYNSMKHGRSQLPEGACGLVFVCTSGSANLPDLISAREAFGAASQRLFRQTSRIAATALLTHLFVYNPEGQSGDVLLSHVIPAEPNGFAIPAAAHGFGPAQHWRYLSTLLGRPSPEDVNPSAETDGYSHV